MVNILAITPDVKYLLTADKNKKFGHKNDIFDNFIKI